jgi:transcription elongation factor Elf1
MIEDKFTVRSMTGSPDDAVADVQCKMCKHRFEVHMHILKAQNCRHVLGKSMTVICPACKAESTTEEKESKIAGLELMAAELRQVIDTHVAQDKTPFKTVSVDMENLILELECKRCGCEFLADCKGGKNSVKTPGLLTITCPLCGAKDETTRQKAVARLEIVAAIVHLKKLESEIAKLKKGENDGESKTVHA